MSNIKLFEHKKIRSHWNAEEEKWYFSVVDVIEVLTESPNPQVYWRVLKKRMKDEGNETVTNCNALKMEAADKSLGLQMLPILNNSSASFSPFHRLKQSHLNNGLPK